ncbi:MAG: lipid II flippase MurJ [Vampirovibrionales bacterium]
MAGVFPMIAYIWLVAEPGIALLFERGEFTAHDTQQVAIALVVLSLSVIPYMLRDAVTRVFYAYNDSKTPLYVGLGAIVINAVLNAYLVKPLGVAGIAGATVVVTVYNAVMLTWLSRRHIRSLGFRLMVVPTLRVGRGVSGDRGGYPVDHGPVAPTSVYDRLVQPGDCAGRDRGDGGRAVHVAGVAAACRGADPCRRSACVHGCAASALSPSPLSLSSISPYAQREASRRREKPPCRGGHRGFAFLWGVYLSEPYTAARLRATATAATVVWRVLVLPSTVWMARSSSTIASTDGRRLMAEPMPTPAAPAPMASATLPW